MDEISVYDKIMLENEKKRRKYGNKRNFFNINLHLIDHRWFRNGIDSSLSCDDARGSADTT